MSVHEPLWYCVRSVNGSEWGLMNTNGPLMRDLARLYAEFVCASKIFSL